MHDLYRLDENLCKELKAFGKSDSISSSSLDTIVKLAQAVKYVDTIIKNREEEEYSMRGSYGSYEGGGSGRSYEGGSGRSYEGGSGRSMLGGYYYDDGGMSGRRGRGANGRFVSRDGSEIARKLREMMEEAPDENAKREIQRLAEKMEQM